MRGEKIPRKGGPAYQKRLFVNQTTDLRRRGETWRDGADTIRMRTTARPQAFCQPNLKTNTDG